MMSNKLTVTRADSVVHLLRSHKALSFSGLRTLIVPPISKTRLRKVVTELTDKRILKRRLNHAYGGTSVYFEVAEPFRSDDDGGSIHHTMLTHNDLCAFAAELLRRSFPGSVCIREHAIPRNQTLRNVMSYVDGSWDSLPDILLIVPGQAGGAPAFVAVEIERSVKSSKRLLKKFRKYAAGTQLDGVIYLSEEDRVLATLRQRYQSEVAGWARRVGHYKNHFLVTAGCPTKKALEFAKPRTSANSVISLQVWLQALAAIPLSARRDGSAVWGDSVCPGPLNALL